MKLLPSILLVLAFILHFSLQAQRAVQISTLGKEIKLDGKLDDAWLSVHPSTGFTQIEPNKGEAASRKTKVRIAQYGGAIYLFVTCFVNEKNEIAARIQRRDQLGESDDAVAILLDSYNDKRSAFLFMVNAIGTLTDGKITDDGKGSDYNWDTEWEAVTLVQDDRWNLEVRIPFESVQFNPNSTEWGVNFGRVIRAEQEVVWWSPVSESFRVSQSGTLQGIKIGHTRRHDFRMFPYATGRYQNTESTEGKIAGDAGVDMQYQYRSNLKANVTINPDFATVEGDKEQINLTPWELRFPDKRLFFQDGNEMFGTRISTFYSRRIGDMQYGGKLTGKTGKIQYNALTARTKRNTANNDPQAWYNAVRLKGDFMKSSTLGMTYADKITDTSYVRSLSMDYVINLGKTWKLTGQYVGSAPGDWASHSAWFVRFARENNLYHYHLRYSNIGKNFQDNVNQTGYVPDDDRHELDGDFNYRFWMNNAIKYWYVKSKNNVFWSQAGRLRSWYLTYGSRLYFKNRINLDFYYNNEYKYLDEQAFYNHYYNIRIGYNTDEATYVKGAYTFGRNFDQDFKLWELNAKLQLFKKLSINYEFNYLTFAPDPEDETTMINVLGLDYFFHKDLWVRLFAQNNSAHNKYYLYSLFGWRFKPPFGALYFIVNTDQFVNPTNALYKQTQVVFLKLTYPIAFR